VKGKKWENITRWGLFKNERERKKRKGICIPSYILLVGVCEKKKRKRKGKRELLQCALLIWRVRLSFENENVFEQNEEERQRESERCFEKSKKRAEEGDYSTGKRPCSA